MKNIFLLLAIPLLFDCCSKKDIEMIQAPVSQTDDARTFLLKDVVVDHLPAPYFHFSYDSLHYIKQIGFAAGYDAYQVEYENKRVIKMIKERNGNMITYTYNNGNVAEINEFSGTSGKKEFRYQFDYDTRNELTQVLWFNFFYSDTPTLFKKALLEYQPDGNLSSIDQYSNSTGQMKWTARHQFYNYDTNVNVDGFYMLKDFFDTFLFLPQVQIQKHNPLREVITGINDDFDIRFTYNYKNGLPVAKAGIIHQTRGKTEGQTIMVSDFFTYY